VNSGCNSAASPPKTQEERANLKNRKAIFEICSLHKFFSPPLAADILESANNEWINPVTHVNRGNWSDCLTTNDVNKISIQQNVTAGAE
jgi:hypothetical protein